MKTAPVRTPLRLLGAQAVAAIVTAGYVFGMTLTGARVDPWIAVALQGIVAALMSGRFGLGPGWMGLQAALPPLALLALQMQLPSWIYLAAFGVLFLVYSNAAGERVPLYLSNRKTWAALETFLEPGQAGRMLDLGAGVGGTLLHLARMRPDWTFIGVESALIPYLIARIRLKLAGLHNVEFRFGDMWAEDLRTLDVVYAFLSPEPMAKLLDKAEAEMKPGALLISNSFWLDGAPFDAEIQLGDRRQTRLITKRT